MVLEFVIWLLLNIVVDAFGDDKKDSNTSFRSFPQSSVLRIDLELVSFKPVVDVTGDSKVLKKILKEGEGFVTADEGASVTGKWIVHVAFALYTMRQLMLCSKN